MKGKFSGSFLAMASGIAMVSIILSPPAFAEKNKDKKNKHKTPFSSQIGQEIKNEGDSIKYDSNKLVDKTNKNANAAFQGFSKTERDSVLNYYSMQNQALPPGLSKKVARGGNLPPGWQKKISKGEVLSADIYKHAEPLPKDIVISLPSMAPGTSLVKIDNRILKVADATKTIIDVIDLP